MFWLDSWVVGLTLVGLTICVHAVALIRITMVLRALRGRLFPGGAATGAWGASALVGTVGAMLAAVHGFEALIWAIAYVLIGAIDNMPAAMLYSIDSMTTRGAVAIRLEEQWLLLGALEAADGMLLFGISTGFLFAMAAEIWPPDPSRAAQARKEPPQ